MGKKTWSFAAPILDIQKETLVEMLENVRQTRNDLAHFRGEISASSRDELKSCANWLRNRYRDYERETETDRSVQEGKPAYGSGHDRAAKKAAGSRYAALADWLRQQKENQVSLRFTQIETIIRSPLPDSALALRAWWANDRVGHTHSILWLAAGWKVSYVDLDGKQVTFTRVGPDENG